jgi:hypothetical protein
VSEPTLLDKVILAAVLWPIVAVSTAKRLVKRLFWCSWAGHAWSTQVGPAYCLRCELWTP